MTPIAKGLVVFLFFSSIAFLGGALALNANSYNWKQHAEGLDDYNFSSEGEGESLRWTASRLRTDPANPSPTIRSSEVEAEVILAAREDQLRRIQTELATLTGDDPNQPNGQIAQAERRLKEVRERIQQDTQALLDYRQVLDAEQQKMAAALRVVSDKTVDVVKEINAVRTEANERRLDFHRLQNQYEQIKTDRYRLETQQEQLTDLLRRLNITIRSLERRNALLKKALPPTATSTNTSTESDSTPEGSTEN